MGDDVPQSLSTGEAEVHPSLTGVRPLLRTFNEIREPQPRTARIRVEGTGETPWAGALRPLDQTELDRK